MCENYFSHLSFVSQTANWAFLRLFLAMYLMFFCQIIRVVCSVESKPEFFTAVSEKVLRDEMKVEALRAAAVLSPMSCCPERLCRTQMHVGVTHQCSSISSCTILFCLKKINVSQKH